MPTVHLIIKGRVQGVFYRATARKVAGEIGVTGWVKNTAEGNVEIVATGSKDQLKNLFNGVELARQRQLLLMFW